MKERPILFSGPMVRAILEARKTQTRRVVKPMPTGKFVQISKDRRGRAHYFWDHEPQEQIGPGVWKVDAAVCPYGQSSDRLWVRETWRSDRAYDKMSPRQMIPGSHVEFEDGVIQHAEFAPEVYNSGRTRASIHMPRWASRITLEIVSVRVERLQDISEADAKAEGIYCEELPGEYAQDQHGPFWPTPRQAYRDLWQSINGEESWDANPWVWAIEFKRAKD